MRSHTRAIFSLESSIFRAIQCFAGLMVILACSITTFGLANLPQSKEKVPLSPAARKALETVLGDVKASTPFTLVPESAAPVIASLPKSFLDSCKDIVAEWPMGTDTDRWTVRVLFSTRNESGIEAVLALRCGSSDSQMKEWYDERPAVVVLTHESGTLRLVPLAKDCKDCAPFYHVEFSKTYSAPGTKLVELGAEYSDDNPAADGTDHQDGNRFVVVSLPAGDQVLSMDQYTEANSVDDEAGTDTVWVCEAKIDYGHDAAGNVDTIGAVTRCTVDKRPDPSGTKKQSFRWNPTTQRFVEVKPIPH